jgi:apolipoprotein N-acyltransferase
LSTLPAWLALSAIAAITGLRSALVAAALARARTRGVPLWLGFAVFQVFIELVVPGFFPWTSALATHTVPLWAQLASWGGASAVSFWICLVNGLVAEAALKALARQLGPARNRVLAALAVISGVSALGYAQGRTERARQAAAPMLRVVLGQQASGDELTDDIATLRDLALERQQREGPSDLVVFPESVSPGPLRLADASRLARDYWLRDRQRPLASPRLQSALLLGLLVQAPDGLENSALLVAPSGVVQGRYVKQTLMPVGETALVNASWAGGLAQSAESFHVSEAGPVLSVRGHPLSISICFEDILAEPVRLDVARTDAELLVNLTSDRWFKGSSAVDFHLALAQLRAVEERKYLLRSTRDGISAVVDSTGGLVAAADRNRTSVIGAKIPLLSGSTFYARFAAAERVLLLLAGGLLLGVVVLRKPR